MPIVQINFMEGRDVAKKRLLIQSVTKAVCESLDVPPSKVRIILSEMKPEHYASGGVLRLDEP